jgi:shikimate kinase
MNTVPLVERRMRALLTLVRALRDGNTYMDPHDVSRVLLFGLDHDLFSPAQVERLVEEAWPDNWLLRVRFAVRLLSYNERRMWDETWSESQGRLREWLLLAAFDHLGEDVTILDVSTVVNSSYELGRLWEFLTWWNGGPRLAVPIASRASEFEHGLRNSDNVSRVIAFMLIVGFSGVGKSALAAELQTLGNSAVDVDRISGTEDPELAELFAKLGAVRARTLLYKRFVESRHLSAEDNILIVGGSTTSLADGRRLLMKTVGPIVRLEASGNEIIKRLRADPLHAMHSFCEGDFGARQIARIQRIRADHYYAADCAVDTDRWTPSSLASFIAGRQT